MTELKCPNCGGKQFDELTGKRRCTYCGAEFEVDKDEAIVSLGYFRCTPENNVAIPGLGPCDIRYTTGQTDWLSWINRETVGVRPHPIPRITRPGVSARYWDAKLAIGRAFLPAIKGLVNLLGGTP